MLEQEEKEIKNKKEEKEKLEHNLETPADSSLEKSKRGSNDIDEFDTDELADELFDECKLYFFKWKLFVLVAPYSNWTDKFKWDEEAKRILKEIFGYEEFREQQREVINCTLSAANAFALIPSGGGKSLAFQLPAIIEEDSKMN